MRSGTTAATLVRTTYLELTSPADLVPARDPGPGYAFARATEPSPEFNRFFYTGVGGDHFWRDRLGWSFGRWMELLARSDYETWYLASRGTPAGYVEIDARDLPDVELTCLGLLPAYHGRGLGGWLLDRATRRGFELGRRVWLHTCTLDGPNALPAYQRRGYRPFKVEDQLVELPPEPAGPWPGAARPRTGS
jgi:GNAT superfamily N-acetyltransferase